MINIVLFGPPGAGKGVQAGKIAERFGIKHLSTGEIIRKEIASGSQLGAEMGEYIARGELAPDSLVLDMVEDYLDHHPGTRGIVFDGFPRTIAQAEGFDRLLGHHGAKVNVMLALEVPEDEAVGRIIVRGKREGRSDDLTEETIRNRLAIYNAVTACVAGYYAAQDKYVPINGIGSVEDIFERLVSEVEKHI